MYKTDIHRPSEHSPERESSDLQTHCSDDTEPNYWS